MYKVLFILLIFCFYYFNSFATLINNGATITITSGATINSSSDIKNSSFNESDGAITLFGELLLGRDWINSANNQVFTTNSTGTVIFNGSNQSIYGSTTFPNLLKNITTAATLYFPTKDINKTTITGDIDLQGIDGAMLSLKSSTPGEQWVFNPKGGRAFDYIDVIDSKNINSTIIDVTKKQVINSGNNTKWKFAFNVRFIAQDNGSIDGTTTQIVSNGDDCSSVTANPNTGYLFKNWTGDYKGTENPLTITNVTKDMTIDANFEVIELTVNFIINGKGSIDGNKSQTVVYGEDCSSVTATPDTGYYFDNWTGDYDGNDNPLTIENVTQNMTITANFATHKFTITFTEGAGGTITGTLVQLIDYDCSTGEVTAVPNDDFSFVTWETDYVGDDNPLIIKNVKSDMTINAKFQDNATITKMVAGSLFNIDQSEVSGLTQFTHKPYIYGTYHHPFINNKKIRKRRSRNISKPTNKKPLTNVDALWTKKLYLYRRSSFYKAYASGDTCKEYLLANPIDNLLVRLYLRTKEKKVKYNKFIRLFYLTSPTITALRNQDDSNDITQATLNETFIIKGTFFSRNSRAKAPKVWLEYINGRNKIKKLNLKVIKPYKFANAYNKPQKSCMKVNSGVSEISVKMPKSWRKDWDHTTNHNIVIDNGIGLATVDFQTY